MLFLSFFSDYCIWIVASAILLIYFIIDTWVKPKLQAKETKQLLEKLAAEFGYRLGRTEGPADFVLENDDRILYVKALYVPSHSAITINARFTWSLTYGGLFSKVKPGKAYPYQRYLSEIEAFLKWDLASEKPALKVVLICQATEKIQKYLNESEIAIVKPGEKVYDYKFITADRLNEDFRRL